MTFDLQDRDLVKRRGGNDPYADYSDDRQDSDDIKPAHKLDSPENQLLHKRLLDDFQRELDRQRDNRIEQAIDAAFYDNEQWREEDAAELEERGQVPIVYNVISSSVDWVTGTERRGRSDFKVLPRRKEDGPAAQRKSEILKYLSDVNKTPYERSRAFHDAVKVGLGWLEDGINADPDEERIYSRAESYRNMLHDSSATRLDLQDGRYIFRAKWVDMDVAQSIFPERAGTIEASVDYDFSGPLIDTYGDDVMDEQEERLDEHDFSYSNSRHGFDRPRVRLIEGWYKNFSVPFDRMRGGKFSGEIYDQYSVGHMNELKNGNASKGRGMGGLMHVALFTPVGLLHHSPSPYRHNRFPFTPVWGYRRDSDGLPYGMIRRLRDIQEDVNKRASKALYILSTNKVIVDEEALPESTTIEDIQQEWSRPDAVIVKKRGGEIKTDVERDLAQWHVEMMSRSIQMIQSASGVTDENMGRSTNATSGYAIERRQDQGSLASSHFFDNYRYSKQIQGEKQLSLVEQYMEEEKQFRITNSRGTPQYVTINDGDPANDILRSAADFVIDEQEWQATLRQSAVRELMQIMPQLGEQLGLIVIDLLVDEMDLKNRDEIVKRIRQMTGQTDPDAEDDDPEKLKQDQAQTAKAEFDARLGDAQLRKLEADVDKVIAATEEVRAKIASAKDKNALDRVTVQDRALDAARKIIDVPVTADIADVITHEAGLDSRTDLERQAAQQTQNAQSPQ